VKVYTTIKIFSPSLKTAHLVGGFLSKDKKIHRSQELPEILNKMKLKQQSGNLVKKPERIAFCEAD